MQVLERCRQIVTRAKAERESLKKLLIYIGLLLMNAYTVLSITRDDDLREVKAAYKRALLRNHPDKLAQASNMDEPSYTVDQIFNAYETVCKNLNSGLELQNVAEADEGEVISYNEVTDLSHFEVDMTGQIWTKHCRCGEQGYVLSVEELEANGNADEIAVQCLNCSLWILVQYSVEE